MVLHLRPLDYKDPANKIFEYKYIPKWPLRKGVNISTKQDLNYAMPLLNNLKKMFYNFNYI